MNLDQLLAQYGQAGRVQRPPMGGFRPTGSYRPMGGYQPAGGWGTGSGPQANVGGANQYQRTYIPPNTPEATNLPAAPDDSYTPLDNSLYVAQIQAGLGGPPGENQIIATPSAVPGATESLLNMYAPGWQDALGGTSVSPGSTGSTGSYYSGGGGGGITTEQAQAILNEYIAMLNMPGGDPTMAGLQGSLDDWRQQMMQSLRRGRRADLGDLRQMNQRGRRQIRNSARGARQETGDIYRNLLTYLGNNSENSYANVRPRRAGRGARSDALLADQGAGTAAVDREVRSNRGERRQNAGAFEQLVGLLGANQASGQADMIANARADRADAVSGIQSNAQSARNDLLDQYIAARQGVGQQYRTNRLNFLNQFGQQNFALAQGEAQNQQAIRNAILQMALQYGLDLPDYFFAQGAPQ